MQSQQLCTWHGNSATAACSRGDAASGRELVQQILKLVVRHGIDSLNNVHVAADVPVATAAAAAATAHNSAAASFGGDVVSVAAAP